MKTSRRPKAIIEPLVFLLSAYLLARLQRSSEALMGFAVLLLAAYPALLTGEALVLLRPGLP